jgi:hypothetical protein
MYGTCRNGILDLNMLPADLDGNDEGDPLFCTQIPSAGGYATIEGVGESPDLLDQEHGGVVPEVLGAKIHVGISAATGGSDEQATDANVANPVAATIPSGTETLPPADGTNVPLGDEGGDATEVRSTPEEPYVGMRFDTIEEAKLHYNAYAKRLGFSIKSNTSRRSAFTGVLNKQQFCCNKFRKPRTDNVPAVPEPESLSSEPDSDEGEGNQSRSSSKKHKTSETMKKRRRESIKQTNCKASMRVKLIENKFEVTAFVPEHNHDLNNKPSLSKYLRSHQGIPREEKNFLEILHHCNLETGCMMSVMSEFYGCEKLVPYTTKKISNLRTSLRTSET